MAEHNYVVNKKYILVGEFYSEMTSFDNGNDTLTSVLNFELFKKWHSEQNNDKIFIVKKIFIHGIDYIDSRIDSVKIMTNEFNKSNKTSVERLLLLKINIGIVEITMPDNNIKPIDAVFNFMPFKNWLNEWKNDEFDLKKILIQSVDNFGPRIGFVKFNAQVIHKSTQKTIPGIVFMRGGSVAILMILHCENQKYVVLTVQPRVPTGNMNFPEIPAGMLDSSRNFAGTAAKEVEEETGIVINETELIDLTYMAYNGYYNGMYPSAGGCDEFIRLFLYQKDITAEKLADLNGKLTGLREEGELIKLRLVLLEDVWRIAPDSKTLSALYLYERLIK